MASTLLTCHRYDQALPHARRCLTLDPLHEPSHRLLMRLYAATGDPVAVIRQYEQYSQVLAAELGIAPPLETTILYRELRKVGDVGQSPTFEVANFCGSMIQSRLACTAHLTQKT